MSAHGLKLKSGWILLQLLKNIARQIGIAKRLYVDAGLEPKVNKGHVRMILCEFGLQSSLSAASAVAVKCY